jgi:ABC-2 type transport system permease protein
MSSVIKSKFNKYWKVVSISWMNGFAYPLSFWMWRLRQVMSMVIAISLWESIFLTTQHVFEYQQAQMLTYIFISNIIGFIVLSSRTIEVSSIITSGDLSLYLIKPVQFFVYWFSRDLADKTQNAIFSFFELPHFFDIS